jgi:hypothetical protein
MFRPLAQTGCRSGLHWIIPAWRGVVGITCRRARWQVNHFPLACSSALGFQRLPGARDPVGHRRTADDDHHRFRHVQPRCGLDGLVRRPARDSVSRLMAGSLLPIVLGYVVAHYATLLIVEGQRVAINFSNPLGRGWNVFGSAEMGVDSAIFNHPTAIAAIHACTIVGGHVFGIVCAHEKAVALPPPDRALRGQLPLLLVMIGYTCAVLLLLRCRIGCPRCPTWGGR